MEPPKARLGNTDLAVTKLCVGTDWKGKFNLALGNKILCESFKLGINFWDSADNYGTHAYIREAIKKVPREKVIISTKISSLEVAGAKKDFENCLKTLSISYIDILFLHAIDNISELKTSAKVLDWLQKIKRNNLIRAIGVSTHTPKVVGYLAEIENLDLILTPFNKKGIEIRGKINDQLDYVKKAVKNGKGVIAMKILGGGDEDLIDHREEAIRYVLDIPWFASLCIGIRSLKELKEDFKIIYNKNSF